MYRELKETGNFSPLTVEVSKLSVVTLNALLSTETYLSFYYYFQLLISNTQLIINHFQANVIAYCIFLSLMTGLDKE